MYIYIPAIEIFQCAIANRKEASYIYYICHQLLDIGFSKFEKKSILQTNKLKKREIR